MRKNILYIQPYASHVGGVDTVLLQLVDGLNKDEFNPVVVLPSPSPYVEKYEELGAKVLFAPIAVFGKPTSWDYYFKNSIKLLSSMKALHKIVKENKIDIIHSHKMELMGGNIVGTMLGIPTVQTVHELPRRPLIAYQFVGLLNHVFNDKVIVLCERSKTMFKWGKISSNKSIKIYNGINIVKNKLNERMNLRKDLGLSENTKLILTVARLSPMKGIEYLVEAATSLKLKDPAIKVIVVGDVAFDYEKDYKQSLMKKVEEHHLQDTVYFLGLRRDVPDIMSQCDVYVLPSVYDIFPTVILEAMSQGLPIVATDVGGVPEMVRNNTGMIVPPEDSEALALAIADMLDGDYLKMGMNGKELFEVEFTQDKYVAKTVAVYQSLIPQ